MYITHVHHLKVESIINNMFKITFNERVTISLLYLFLTINYDIEIDCKTD